MRGNTSPRSNQQAARTIVVHTPEPGAGAGQYVAEFVIGLAQDGERVKLFCPSNFLYTEDVRACGAEVVHAPAREVSHAPLLRRITRNLTFARGALRKFWNSISAKDIVHFQFSMHLILGLAFILAARLKGCFVVLTVHDPLPHRWLLPPWLRWLEILFLRIGYSFSHRLIVHNGVGSQVLADSFHVDPGLVSIIPHGPLNLAVDSVESTQLAEDTASPLRLLLFGSLRENKGIHLAISAVQELQLSPAARPVILTIAGRAPNPAELPYWARCRKQIEIQPKGIEVFEKAWDDAEVAPLFARHDAIILPYVNFYSDSGVAMLALSRQKPLLSTGAGGLGDILRAADCGVLIETPSVAGVVKAIREAASVSSDSLRQKGMNGYRYAQDSRSWRLISRETAKVYDSISAPCGRVLIHTPEPSSSASLYVEALAKALHAEKIPVSVVCPSNLQAIPALRQDGIPILACYPRGTSRDVSFLGKIYQNARFILSSVTTLFGGVKPGDVVHLQYILHLPFGLVFLACARVRRARIVFTVHDPLPHKFLFPARLRFVEMLALRWAYQWSDTLIVHSEAGRRKLIEAFGLPAEKIQVIVHGPYPLKEAVRACSQTDCLEVLQFGSLRENKAPHLAIQAVQKLRGEGVAIRLTIAGQVVNRKEEAYWAQCRALIDPGSSAIRLIDRFISDEDLPELFSSCHCFVLPYTTFSSDSGVAYMALANAKAIVCTKAGGLGWLLENSQGGISISEATVEGVAAALRYTAQLGPEQLERMGQRGADWVLGSCGWGTVAQATRRVYELYLPELRHSAQREETVPVEVAR